MASKPMSEYTVEELEAGFKKASAVGTTLVSIYGILFVLMIGYAWMSNWEFDMKTPLIVMVLCMMTTALPMLASRGKFAKELDKRKSSPSNQDASN